MITQPYESAITAARAVLTNVTPDQLGASTPCQSWKVSDLINHLVGSQSFFGNALTDQPPTAGPDFASGDYVGAFDSATATTLAAFQADGAMGKMCALPFGTLPGAALLGLASTDTFTHAWDLAKATGQSTDLDPTLAAELLEGAKQNIPAAFRGEDGKSPFGAEQAAPEGASAADQLAAFLGRSV
ncbi:MAG TPA: TIGR03086 family metal-binding protein [Ilumatobacteraceae bacterium]|jgi:uncharacterized protein (TIGR03086 family)